MEVKKYVAQNMPEALQKIKEELGQNAVILETRKIKQGGNAFGLFGKTMIEITATGGIKKEKAKNRLSLSKTPPPPYQEKYTPPEPEIFQPPSLDENEKRRLLNPIKSEIGELKDMVHEMYRQQAAEKGDQGSIRSMRYEMTELKNMLNSIMSSPSHRLQDMHENLLSLYQQMIYNGVEEKFAQRLIEEAGKKIPKDKLEVFSYVKLYVARLFMQVIKTIDPFKNKASQPSIIVFIGSTGVGKTTTIAKFAAQKRMENPEMKIALISTDVFRLSGIDQLKEYARRIKIPCKTAADASHLDEALKEFKDCGLILIDTPGASQRDNAKLGELRSLFRGREEIINFLVLNSTTKDNELNEITKRYGTIPLTGIIFTKLDEAITYGGIFNHSIRFKLPIFCLTMGQNVPEDFEYASRERLIDLLLNISGDDE